MEAVELQTQDERNREIEDIEAKALHYPQAHCPVEHHFAPGVYLRQVTMPAGHFAMGHLHKTEHLNIIVRGRALASIDGVIKEFKGGDVFVCHPGARKVLLVIEETVWQNIHAIDTSEIENVSQLTLSQQEDLVAKIAPEIIDPSRAFLDHQNLISSDIKQLQAELK